MIRSRILCASLMHTAHHHRSKTYLTTAIRYALFGIASLPFVMPTYAELNTSRSLTVVGADSDSSKNLPDTPDTKPDTVLALDAYLQSFDDTANAFDGFDFEVITQQAAEQTTSQANQDNHQISQLDAFAGKSDNPSLNTAKLTDKHDTRFASKSLAKLAENYHIKSDPDAHRCQGMWIQPIHQATRTNNPTAPKLDENGNLMTAGGIFAQADYGYYDAQTYAELSGNVIVEQNGQRVTADKLTLDTQTGQATASGQVQFSDGGASDNSAGIIGVAENLVYRTDGQTATAQDVAFASTTINAHGYASQMDKISSSEYQLQNVMFTTCPPTERKWYLDADSIDINTDTGRAIAKNTTLRIKKVPVFYLPYFNFPIDARRSSGFLLPSMGFGASDSFEISTPYYLNLAPNYDATITPTVFTNRNPMLTGEFRYLTQDYGSGVLTASYLPKDQQYHDKDRSRVQFDHTWQPKRFDKITTYAQYQSVSDANYLSDFNALGVESAKLNLPRRIGANFLDENVSADLRFEDFQRLDGFGLDGRPITDKDRPYARLPQLSVNYRLPRIWMGTPSGLELGGIHNSAYFKKSIKDNSEPEKSGGRIFNQFTASYPLLRSWGYLTPKLSLTHLYTSYDEDSLADQNITKKNGRHSVFAPTVSLDAGLFFEKAGAPFGMRQDTGGYQVLTPRLHYTYTPFKDQHNVPNFETKIAQLSYEQLLNNNWFLGHDRIQDLHAITPAVSYRYIDKMGRTRFEGGIAEQILLSHTRVGINDSENYRSKSSGLAWQASLQPKDNLWFDASGSFRTNYDLSSIVAQIRYRPSDRKLFNLGIVKRKQNRAFNQSALSAYTASAIFPINNRWRMMGQLQYDYNLDYVMDSLMGLNYEDCCYGLSIYARRYRDAFNPHLPPDTAVMAEVRLNGIGGGGRLNRLLSEKVLGYDQVQNAWRHDY